jgi:PAS domain S-box-containing protein
VDQQGQVIVDSASKNVASGLANVHSTADSSLSKLALPGGEGSSLIGVETPFTQITIGSAQEKNYLSCTNWSTVPSLGWKVIVSKPMFPVEVELARHNLEMIEELLGLMLLAIIISNAIGNRLTRPLIELESYALKLASGDLATRPATAFVVTQEAHSLRSAFSRMAIALEESWKEQKAVTKSAEVAAIEAQERARHVAALNKLGQELSLTFDLKSICRAAHRYIETQVSASGFVISLFDEREQLIKSAFVWGDGRELDPTLFPYVPLGDGSHSRCIRAKSPVLVEDIIPAKTYKNVHFIGTDEDPRKPQSVLYLPLISFDRVVGTLQVQGYERAQFRPEDIERLMAVASQIAVSINNAMLFEQIEDAKREWEKTFDSMSDGVFLFGDSGILIRVNRAGADMEGADIKELVGKRCCDILAHTEKAECFVGPAIRNGSRVVKEIVILRGARTLLVTIEPVLAEGRVGASICVARDITELRRAEEEVRQQREFAAQLVESAQESIFTFDLDGRVTWFNRRFCETTGYSERDAAGINVRMLVHRDDLQATAESVAHVLDGANETCEARFVRKSGEARWFKTTLTPIKVSGSVTSILAVTRDVTDERLALEQLQRANKLAAVGQLAAGVAHDFNNLLVPILGRAQLLKRQLTDERARRGLEIIEKAALDGAATVRRLQNFSRQRAEDRMEPVGVADLLRDVVELTRTRWRDDALARGVKYEINLSFGEGNVVMGSPSELREVFTNIVINALDAMPEGGRLSIKSQAEGAILHISISDTGLGMSADVRQHIFEPFFTTKGHAGNGLGLAVSYGIIKRHSGSIQVDSAPGLGTTFKITLPLTGRKAAVAHPEIPQADLKARVMVVDDEELVRTTLVDILTNMGLEVVSATGGGQGLTLLSTWPVDLVLTDLSMPEMDGWTFARRIREQFPDIKTVLVTGYGSSVELEEESAGLVDAVVGKPYDYSEIAQVVQRLTGRTAAFEAV